MQHNCTIAFRIHNIPKLYNSAIAIRYVNEMELVATSGSTAPVGRFFIKCDIASSANSFQSAPARFRIAQIYSTWYLCIVNCSATHTPKSEGETFNSVKCRTAWQ